jgi:hypothetical protein
MFWLYCMFTYVLNFFLVREYPWGKNCTQEDKQYVSFVLWIVSPITIWFVVIILIMFKFSHLLVKKDKR